jgi:hypothetical protein
MKGHHLHILLVHLPCIPHPIHFVYGMLKPFFIFYLFSQMETNKVFTICNGFVDAIYVHSQINELGVHLESSNMESWGCIGKPMCHL